MMIGNMRLYRLLQERGINIKDYEEFVAEERKRREQEIARLRAAQPDPMEEMADEVILAMAERIGGM